MNDGGALADLQGWFQRSVTGQDPPVSLAPLADSAAFPAAAGLGVYRRAYVARLTAAMRAQFPALRHALGAALFDDFAADYLRRHPPESYTLHDLGRRFVAYLQEQRPDRQARETWIDFVIDLARFERQVFTLFDAPGAEGLPPVAPDTPADQLWLQPAVRFDRFAFNVAAYYHAVRRGEPTPAPARTAQYVVLVRTDYVVRTVALHVWEHALLYRMATGGSLHDAARATAAAQADPDAFDRAVSTGRARWIDLGLFGG